MTTLFAILIAATAHGAVAKPGVSRIAAVEAPVACGQFENAVGEWQGAAAKEKQFEAEK